MRSLPETIAYLRTMIANPGVDLMLIETAELTALCDEAERAGRLKIEIEETQREDDIRD